MLRKMSQVVCLGISFVLSWPSASFAETTTEVRAFTWTTEVESREPIDDLEAEVELDETPEVSAAGQRIYAHIRVASQVSDNYVTMTWLRNGAEVISHRMNVGVSDAWRTWTYLTAKPMLKGRWSVKVYAASGDLLLEKSIDVVEAKSGPLELTQRDLSKDGRLSTTGVGELKEKRLDVLSFSGDFSEYFRELAALLTCNVRSSRRVACLHRAEGAAHL